MPKKKIAICHYRVGGTDGVSLEIKKRKQILEKHGCEIQLIAGNRSNGADHIIKELEWDNGIIPIIKENGFIYFRRKDLTDDELKAKIHKVSDAIEKQLTEIQLKENYDAALIHNVFSFGGHIAAARAFTKWVDKFNIPIIATHHDFYWERKEFIMPRNGYLRAYMKRYMPPNSINIKHVVINSLAKKELKKRSGIDSVVLPDIFDFNQPKWKTDNFNSDFLKQFCIKPDDLIVLQATRMIPRKGIEIAIDFAKELQNNIEKIRGRVLYNGKILGPETNVVLLLAGYAEDEKRDYLFKLKTKSFDDDIHAKFISGNVKAKRSFHAGAKTYSLWDAYAYADLVTFPSVWEGWGNQFIEAVFAEKPIIIFEYPVFKEDIKHEGYHYISLGNELENKDANELLKLPQKNISQAVQESVSWLLNQATKQKLEENFDIGKKYHGYKIIEDFLSKELRLKKHKTL